jgi:hypothetical protein
MTRVYRVTIVTADHVVNVEAPGVAHALKIAYDTCKQHRWHPAEVNIIQVAGPEVEPEGGWWTTSTPRAL